MSASWFRFEALIRDWSLFAKRTKKTFSIARQIDQSFVDLECYTHGSQECVLLKKPQFASSSGTSRVFELPGLVQDLFPKQLDCLNAGFGLKTQFARKDQHIDSPKLAFLGISRVSIRFVRKFCIGSRHRRCSRPPNLISPLKSQPAS